MSKKVIFIFEEDHDYDKFAREIKSSITEKVGNIEDENEEHLVVKIINLEFK